MRAVIPGPATKRTASRRARSQAVGGQGRRQGRGSRQDSGEGDRRRKSLAEALSDHLDKAVVDDTGLAGFYNFEVALPPDQQAGEWEASLFAELEVQLGLKLAPSKGPVEFVVIDYASPPTDK